MNFIFSLVKGTLLGNYTFLLEHIKGTKAMAVKVQTIIMMIMNGLHDYIAQYVCLIIHAPRRVSQVPPNTFNKAINMCLACFKHYV